MEEVWEFDGEAKPGYRLYVSNRYPRRVAYNCSVCGLLFFEYEYEFDRDEDGKLILTCRKCGEGLE